MADVRVVLGVLLEELLKREKAEFADLRLVISALKDALLRCDDAIAVSNKAIGQQ
jgi:hypothetical protein